MTEGRIFQGTGPALVTPMDLHGEVDLAGFSEHVERMLEGGVDFLVPCGTTGESATLTPAEQRLVIARCVEVAGGRVPVLAGAGSNSTSVARKLALGAAEAGADGVLVVTPYYNKPGPDGLVLHYHAVAEAGLPVILYNVPGRTGANVLPEVVLRIADEVPAVVGVKESSGTVDQVMELVAGSPEGFSVLSGDDHLGLASMACGAHGLISVAANEAPQDMAELIRLAAFGETEAARRIHYRLLPLMRANFLETNPAPVKAALAILGRMGDHLRPPLAPVHPGTRAALKNALIQAEVLA